MKHTFRDKFKDRDKIWDGRIKIKLFQIFDRVLFFINFIKHWLTIISRIFTVNCFLYMIAVHCIATPQDIE